MIVRGFEMEKGVDYVDNFSPTAGLAVARLMMSLAIANDIELHKIDIEQDFLQADKLDEGYPSTFCHKFAHKEGRERLGCTLQELSVLVKSRSSQTLHKGISDVLRTCACD